MNLGLVSPTMSLWRPFGKDVAVYRCRTDDALVALEENSQRNQVRYSKHAGHVLKQPITLSIFEILRVWLGAF